MNYLITILKLIQDYQTSTGQNPYQQHMFQCHPETWERFIREVKRELDALSMFTIPVVMTDQVAKDTIHIAPSPIPVVEAEAL